MKKTFSLIFKLKLQNTILWFVIHMWPERASLLYWDQIITYLINLSLCQCWQRHKNLFISSRSIWTSGEGMFNNWIQMWHLNWNDEIAIYIFSTLHVLKIFAKDHRGNRCIILKKIRENSPSNPLQYSFYFELTFQRFRDHPVFSELYRCLRQTIRKMTF